MGWLVVIPTGPGQEVAVHFPSYEATLSASSENAPFHPPGALPGATSSLRQGAYVEVSAVPFPVSLVSPLSKREPG